MVINRSSLTHLNGFQLLACFDSSIVNSNHFFRLLQKGKSSESKVNFRQARNCWKRVL